MNSKNKRIDLSIVIPALNEEKRIGETLDQLSRFIKKDELLKTLVCEVLVVSATCNDKTHTIATKHGKKIENFKLLKPGKKIGKGRDVQYGMKRTKGKYAMFMDADLATPLKHLPAFYKEATSGYDIVIATRNLRTHHAHLSRRLLSLSGNLAFKVLGGVWVEDSQCGFKLFSHHASRVCFGKQTIMKWGFDMEILAIAKDNRLRIKQVRINDWQDVPGGTFDTSHTFKNAFSSLKELFVIAHNRLRGKY